MKKVWYTAFGFVGTVIGAGFASGKEIQLYFGRCNVLSPLLAGILLGVFCFIFCEIGRIGCYLTEHKIYSNILFFLVKSSNLVILCTTISGSESVFFSLTGIHGGAVITAVIVLVSSVSGKKTLDVFSFMSVIIIIFMALYLFFSTPVLFPTGLFSPLSSLLYAGMNLLTGGFFLCAKTSRYTQKESVLTGIISGVILTTLLVVLFTITNGFNESVLPLIAMANERKLGAFAGIIVYLAMYTTCTGTLYVITKSDFSKNIAVTIVALLVALFDFDKLVKTFYPIIGGIGLIVTFAVILSYFTRIFPRKTKIIS